MNAPLRPLLQLALLSALFASTAVAAPTKDGQGALYAHGSDGAPRAFPLAHTRVEGQVSGPMASVSVTQIFENPYDEAVEATYVFPLPERAAVDDFEIRVAGRVVKGVLKKRHEARADYERAKSEGKSAALLDQERPNIFTISVANIVARERIDVRIHYVDLLAYEKGAYRFDFPMTVGPRFNPGDALGGESQGRGFHPDTTSVPDASRISPPWTKGRSGHDISLELEIETGVPLEHVGCGTHQVATTRDGPSRARVRLSPADTIPNRDFTLKIGVAGGELRTGLIATRPAGAELGHFLMILQPQADADPSKEVTPKEMVFVLDTSCSMSGRPMETAKALMREAIAGMNPRDTFQIFGFDSSVSSLSEHALGNTEENVRHGLEFVNAFHGRGGTYMNAGITAALGMRKDPERIRMVFFLTDGYIGNESEILATLQKNLGAARLFSFGVGSSVNRYLIESMAELGRGVAEVVPLDADPTAVAQRFYERIRKPVLTDVEVTFAGVSVRDLTPLPIPDLFEAQPIVLTGRYEKGGRGRVTVQGRVGARAHRSAVEVTLPDREDDHAEVAKLWARRRLHALEKTQHAQPDANAEEMTQVALSYGLMSKYTSFVAVLHEVRVDPNAPSRTITVPVELPEGVSPAAVAGELSRTEIPPGDPIISIHAPKDARRVTAYFPFGLVKTLTWDGVTATWRARFLVPKGIEDGWYEIAVVIDEAGGASRRLDLPYHLDSAGPEFLVELDRHELGRGDLVTVSVDAVEPSKEVSVWAEPFGDAQILLSGGRPGPGAQTEKLHVRWRGELWVPDDAKPGRYELVVVARDAAGNRAERRVAFSIVE